MLEVCEKNFFFAPKVSRMFFREKPEQTPKMPKVCREYPNCKNSGCSFLHPVILEASTIDTKAEKVKEKVKEEVKCILFMRKNLRSSAHTVRGAAFSAVPRLVDPFDSIDLAKSWITCNGNHDYLYQIREFNTNDIVSHWTHDERYGWHLTRFRQDPNRGYKSDKNPKLRILLIKNKNTLSLWIVDK
jgi:hypothetical protein